MNFVKLSFLTLFIVFSSLLFAVDKEVVSEGFGAVDGGNVELAKKDAVTDALRRALEKEIGAQITSTTVMKNYQLVSDKITSKVQGYIKKWDIVSSKEANGVVTVVVKAIVKEDSLKNDLEMIRTTLERMNNPKIVFMIAEQNVGADYSYWWGKSGGHSTDLQASENAMTEVLIGSGFKIVDRSILMKNIKVKPAFQSAEVSAADVLEMTTGIDADFVIFGKAFAKQGNKVMGSDMISVQSTIVVKVANLRNAQVVGTANERGAKVNIDPVSAGTDSIAMASKKAAEKLIKDMMKSWNEQLNNGDEIEVVVSKIADSSSAFKYENEMKKISNVTSVLFDKLENTTARFRILFIGESNDLAQKLQTLKLKIVEINSKKIVLEPN